MTTSTLDSVPGLGEVRRKALLSRFGSVKRLRVATVEEISQVPGIGRRTAEAILSAITEAPAGPAALPADHSGASATGPPPSP